MSRINEILNKRNNFVTVDEAIKFAAKTEGRYSKYIEMLGSKLNLGKFLGLVNVSKGYKLPRYVAFTYEKSTIIAKWTKNDSGHLDQFIKVKLIKKPKPADFTLSETGKVTLNSVESEDVSKLSSAKQIILSLDREIKNSTPVQVQKELESSKFYTIQNNSGDSVTLKLDKSVNNLNLYNYLATSLKSYKGLGTSSGIISADKSIAPAVLAAIDFYNPKVTYAKLDEPKTAAAAAAAPKSATSSKSPVKFNKNGFNIEEGTEISVRDYGNKIVRGKVEYVEYDDDRNSWTVGYVDNQGETWWCYVYQIQTIAGKPVSSYPELNRFK